MEKYSLTYGKAWANTRASRRKDYLMDYTVALIVYIASLFGILTCIGGMIACKDDKWMVRFCSLTSFVFMGTMYLGGMMIQAIS